MTVGSAPAYGERAENDGKAKVDANPCDTALAAESKG